MLLKISSAILLLYSCLFGASCRASSDFNQRLAKLVAPTLARSSGGNYATTDSYLRSLEVAQPSARVLAAIAPLPKQDAILFIAPTREAETELVYRVIASLSWPHEVGALHCGFGSEGGVQVLFKPRAEKNVRWLLLYQLAAPIQSQVKTEIGPHLNLIPIEEASGKEVGEWSSYCSQ